MVLICNCANVASGSNVGKEVKRTLSLITVYCSLWSFDMEQGTKIRYFLFESAINYARPFVCFWRDSPQRARAFSFTRFLDHTQRRATFCRTPLDEWSTHPKDLYLTTSNTHKRKTSMPPVGFESTILAGERPLTYTLHRAATGTGM
jgi:hypothetical protein